MAPEDMVHQATYPYPPEEVWKAIATKQGLESWLMENDFPEAKVGQRFSFRDRPRPFWDGVCPCEVVEADAPRRLTLLWNTKDKHPSKVSWTLSRTADGGTRLVFRHEGLSGFMGYMMRRGMDKGWSGMVRDSIPYVVAQMRQGRFPPRDEVKGRLRKSGKPATPVPKAA